MAQKGASVHWKGLLENHPIRAPLVTAKCLMVKVRFLEVYLPKKRSKRSTCSAENARTGQSALPKTPETLEPR